MVLLWNIQVTVRVLFCFQGVLLIDCSLGLRANLRLDPLSYRFLTGEGSWIETCFYTYGGKQFWLQSGVSVNLSVVRSSQPICVMPLVNVLIFSAYLFWLSDVRLKIPLYVLASQPGEHMVKKHGFSESRMCDVTHYITEIKCPFMGENHGKPMDYKNVCINHISQIMLEMLCSSTQECHYVVWKRGDSYIELLLKYRPLQILESCFG